MNEFVRLCDENSIPYFILVGHLLEAVHHGGFFPWNDDVDIGIPRPDYDRFLQLASRELSAPFHLDAYRYNPEYQKYSAKITCENVKLLDMSAAVPQEQFSLVDVFPIDGMPDASWVRRIHFFRIMLCRLRMGYAQFSTGIDLQKKGRPFSERIIILVGRFFPVEKMLRADKEFAKADKLLKKYNFYETGYATNAMSVYKQKEVFPRAFLGDGKPYPFEGRLLNGPNQADAYLRQLYGDYMVLPDPDNRNRHNTTVVDGPRNKNND